MEKELEQFAEKLSGINKELSQMQSEWMRHLILVASGLLGILVSLHTGTANCIQIRLCYVLATSLLSLGILSAAISLYAEIYNLTKGRELYVEESKKALREGRNRKPMLVQHRKIFLLSRTIAHVCFALSIVLLALYAVLTSFAC
jgi:hypothetical protein